MANELRKRWPWGTAIACAVPALVGAALWAEAFTRPYVDAGFVVNLLCEIAGAIFVGLAVVVLVVGLLLRRR